eukprot:gnl/MRDRNA2_/MRDRNA2_33460_c0_seq1.p1 gnl/MRDRNA2_/MRDRNA2_33460_c0~~gnl/MRDRNA2_/MRDRNA2_33460_c0_seq1.p1  ORF type:complete len:710 (+),score=82.89 gnl/MRDRNA2_/MRDRNA2_33460_c0_seq1:125-2254(+)
MGLPRRISSDWVLKKLSTGSSVSGRRMVFQAKRNSMWHLRGASKLTDVSEYGQIKEDVHTLAAVLQRRELLFDEDENDRRALLYRVQYLSIACEILQLLIVMVVEFGMVIASRSWTMSIWTANPTIWLARIIVLSLLFLQIIPDMFKFLPFQPRPTLTSRFLEFCGFEEKSKRFLVTQVLLECLCLSAGLLAAMPVLVYGLHTFFLVILVCSVYIALLNVMFDSYHLSLGLITLGFSFTIVLSSFSIIEIAANFVILTFVFQIDSWFLHAMRQGFFGRALQKKLKEVDDTLKFELKLVGGRSGGKVFWTVFLIGFTTLVLTILLSAVSLNPQVSISAQSWLERPGGCLQCPDLKWNLMRSTLQGVFFPWDGDCHPMLTTLIATGDAQWQIYMKFSQSDHIVESQSNYDLSLWAVNETAAGSIEKTQYTFIGVGNNEANCSAVLRHGVKLFESDAQIPNVASGASRVLDTRQFLFAPESKPQRQLEIEFPPQCKTGSNFAVDQNPDDLFLRGSFSHECWAGKSPGPLVFQLNINMPLSTLSGTSCFEPFGWALGGVACSMAAAFVIFLLMPWSALPNGMPEKQKSWPIVPRIGNASIATTPGKNPIAPHLIEEETQGKEEQDQVFDLPSLNVPSMRSLPSPLTKTPVLRVSSMLIKDSSPSILANGSGIGPTLPMCQKRSSTAPLTDQSVLVVPIDASPIIVQRSLQSFE